MMSSHSSLLVLYAMPLDASNTRTSGQLANDIFGINTSVSEPQDPVNGRSQVLRCSRGQLNYMPACGTDGQACYPFVNQSVSFVNGILQVPINYNIAGIDSGTVVNWVAAEAQSEIFCVSHQCSTLMVVYNRLTFHDLPLLACITADILLAQTPPIDLYSFNQIMHVIPDPGQVSAFMSCYSSSILYGCPSSRVWSSYRTAPCRIQRRILR
jgi:hypothetical protein